MAKRTAGTVKSSAPDAEDLAAECLIAFGQGIHHTQRLAPDAIAVLRKQFHPRLKKHAKDWPKIGESVLSHARHLGALATLQAQGSMLIEKKHVVEAIKIKVPPAPLKNLRICEICA